MALLFRTRFYPVDRTWALPSYKHHALEAQAAEEITPPLLGSLSKMRRERKVEVRDDTRRVHVSSVAPGALFSLASFSNAIRNDLVRSLPLMIVEWLMCAFSSSTRMNIFAVLLSASSKRF